MNHIRDYMIIDNDNIKIIFLILHEKSRYQNIDIPKKWSVYQLSAKDLHQKINNQDYGIKIKKNIMKD